jgi:hypothetical protein
MSECPNLNIVFATAESLVIVCCDDGTEPTAFYKSDDGSESFMLVVVMRRMFKTAEAVFKFAMSVWSRSLMAAL